jgi:hypothetical protein
LLDNAFSQIESIKSASAGAQDVIVAACQKDIQDNGLYIGNWLL